MAIGFRSLFVRDKQAPRRRQVFQGSSKTIFDGPEPGTYVLHFKDDVSVPDQEGVVIDGKGAINNRVSSLLMSRLKELGVPTHLIRRLNMREQLVCAAEVVPVRVTIHNVAVDEFAERLGLPVNQSLPRPIFEFSYNSRELNYPIVSSYHAEVLEWLRVDEIEDMTAICQRTNDFLSGHFLAIGLKLLNFTVEFGRLYRGDFYEDSQLILIDELSQDTCSLLDLHTGQRLDRSALSERGVEIYHTGAKRFGLLDDHNPSDATLFFDREDEENGDAC